MRSKVRLISLLLYELTVVGSSVIYLATDFVTNDVIPSVRLFSYVQLVMAGLLLLVWLIDMAILRRRLRFGVYFMLAAISFIQLAPAVLWFLFNGIPVAEPGTFMSAAVMGHWIYGVLHIAVIVWGVINIIGYR